MISFYAWVSGFRSSQKPLFIRMSALQSDWSYAGLKGIIPSLLHYSLLGYNFFIPDAVGNRLVYIFNITSKPITPSFLLYLFTLLLSQHRFYTEDENSFIG